MMPRISFQAIGLAVVVALAAAPCSWAVVMHNDDEPAVTPPAEVMGAWGTNASCVVIAPNFIITTCHQGGAGTVNIGNETYLVAQDIRHGTADVRVSRITNPDGSNADLDTWAELYTSTDEVSQGQPFLLGGFGKSRNAPLVTDHIVYGYTWTTESAVGNTLRWGTNRIDDTDAKLDKAGRYSQVLIADFDDLDAAHGEPTAFEAALAEFDSGGGWFLPDGDQWRLAGLNRGVEHTDETWFRNENHPTVLDPDEIDAVRISIYHEDVYEIIRTAGDTNGDLVVDIVDLTRLAGNWYDPGPLSWYEGEFTGDGVIDIEDLTAMATNWGAVAVTVPEGWQTSVGDPSGSLVPEPATSVLFLVGAAALLKRRR